MPHNIQTTRLGLKSVGGVINFVLPTPIHGVYSVGVQSFTAMNSWYNVRAGKNNQFVFTDALASTNTATIPAGVYDSSSLETELQTQLNATTTDGNTFTVSLDVSTLKYTIQSTGNFDVNGTNASHTAGALTGFVTEQTGSGAYTADNLPDLVTDRVIVLRSSRLSNPKRQFYESSVNMETSAIEFIPVTASQGALFTHRIEPDNDTRIDAGYVLSEMDFSVYDEDGIPLDLNGVEFYLDLDVKYI